MWYIMESTLSSAVLWSHFSLFYMYFVTVSIDSSLISSTVLSSEESEGSSQDEDEEEEEFEEEGEEQSQITKLEGDASSDSEHAQWHSVDWTLCSMWTHDVNKVTVLSVVNARCGVIMP